MEKWESGQGKNGPGSEGKWRGKANPRGASTDWGRGSLAAEQSSRAHGGVAQVFSERSFNNCKLIKLIRNAARR